MTTILKGKTVTRPSTTPLGSSILDHATVVTSDVHFGLTNEAGLWVSYNCLDTFSSTEQCPDPTEDKEFETAPWIPAFEFAAYAAVQCNLVGLDLADQKSEIKRVFEANEGRGVEKALLVNRFVPRTQVQADLRPIHRRGVWEAPVDLTPATPDIDVKVALAILEGYAATQYAGVPTIHMPRAAATLLTANGLLKWVGSKCFTVLGSKVAIGGGYDLEDLPLTGELDLYATGEVYIERSSTVEVQTHELTGATGAAFDSNTGVSLVERQYRAAVDCFVAKATATIW